MTCGNVCGGGQNEVEEGPIGLDVLNHMRNGVEVVENTSRWVRSVVERHKGNVCLPEWLSEGKVTGLVDETETHNATDGLVRHDQRGLWVCHLCTEFSSGRANGVVLERTKDGETAIDWTLRIGFHDKLGHDALREREKIGACQKMK